MNWICKRCHHIFNDSNKKCNCDVSPSPWEPLPEINDTIRLDWFEHHSSLFRFLGHPSMDGKYPCWSVWTPKEGTTTRKTLREAIDASMDLE
jgi:rubrerythrin